MRLPLLVVVTGMPSSGKTTVAEGLARRLRAGHHDAEKIKELPARFESGTHNALKLAGGLIELDTSEPVDLDALADRVREFY